MGTYEKVERAKKYKQILYEIVEKYLEEKEDIIINSGQLKFFKGLMIRHLALSTNIKIRAPRTRILEYMDDTLLRHNDDVIAYFDREKNTKAFLESSYCEDFPGIQEFQPQCIDFPFLLLQRAQSEMELAFKAYIHEKSSLDYSEEDSKSKKKISEKKRTDDKKAADNMSEISSEELAEQAMDLRKAERYLELLMSIALYEIILRETYAQIQMKMSNDMELSLLQEESNKKNQFFAEIKACKDMEKRKVMLDELYDMTKEYYGKLCEFTFFSYSLGCFVIHQTNLYAMLRIIVLIEVININSDYQYGTKEERINEREQADFWKRQIYALLKEDVLFACVERRKNLSNMYKQLNLIYNEKKLFPDLFRTEPYSYFEDYAYNDIVALKNYISIIKKGRVEERALKDEKRMWHIADKLAQPIWHAIWDIDNLQKNALEAKKKKS